MPELTLEQIEKVLDARVRPMLAQHGGNLQVVSCRDGILRVRLLGQCANCPSAVVTAEELVALPLREELPAIQQVVLDTSVSDETWDMAKSILKSRRAQRESCGSA